MHRLRLLVIALTLVTVVTPGLRASAQTGDSITCDDFTSQNGAQIVLDYDNDRFADLDEDGDGIACPDLPGKTSDDAETTSAIPLGADVTDITDILGDSDDATGIDDWDAGAIWTGTGQIDTIAIATIDDAAAHIVLTLDDDIADEDDAFDLAIAWLPTDADTAPSTITLDDGTIVYHGISDDLAETFPDTTTYDDLGGAPGDLRIILFPGDDGIATIDIGIGLGGELVDMVPDAPTPQTDLDPDTYLAIVRTDLDTFQDQIDTFDTLLISSSADLTDDDRQILTDILLEWATATDRSTAVEPPTGYEDIQTTFEDLTGALENVATEMNEGNAADPDTILTEFAAAQTAATDLDTLLTAEGA